MMRGKFVVRMTPLITFCLVLALLGSAEAAIKIGVIGPFTGPVAFNGEEMKKGMMLAVDEVNAKGGLLGQKVELAFGDTESKPDKGVAVVTKLITRDKVLVVGGGYHSSVNIATSEVCQREKTPVVVAIAISPTITARGLDTRFGPFFGIPSFVFGPTGGLLHCSNEYVEMDSVLKTIKVLACFIVDWCCVN